MKYRVAFPVKVMSQPRKGGLVDEQERAITINVEAEDPGFAVMAVQIALQEVLDCALDVEKENADG